MQPAAEALIASKLGSRSIQTDRLVACCALYPVLSGDIDHQNDAIEAMPDGWWYSALLSGRP